MRSFKYNHQYLAVYISGIIALATTIWVVQMWYSSANSEIAKEFERIYEQADDIIIFAQGAGRDKFVMPTSGIGRDIKQGHKLIFFKTERCGVIAIGQNRPYDSGALNVFAEKCGMDSIHILTDSEFKGLVSMLNNERIKG